MRGRLGGGSDEQAGGHIEPGLHSQRRRQGRRSRGRAERPDGAPGRPLVRLDRQDQPGCDRGAYAAAGGTRLGAVCHRRSLARGARPLLQPLLERDAVAAAALAAGTDAFRPSQPAGLSRRQRAVRGSPGAAAAPHRHHLDPRLPSARAGGVVANQERDPADRLLPAHAFPLARHARQHPGGLDLHPRPAGERSARLPDRERRREFRRLRAAHRRRRPAARRRAAARQPDHPGRRVPGRDRARRVRADGRAGLQLARHRAPATQPGRAMPDPRRRPHGPDQGPAPSPVRLQAPARDPSAMAPRDHVPADRRREPTGRRRLPGPARGPGARGGLHQQHLQRAGLGAAAPDGPRRHARGDLRIHARGAHLPGHSAARRHEPGRQGIHRSPEPGKPGRAGAVPGSPARHGSSAPRSWSIRSIRTRSPMRSIPPCA